MKKPLVQLKHFRNEKRLTQQEMADFIGVSLSMYEKVERGYIKASRNFMDAIKARYSQIDINKIFFE